MRSILDQKLRGKTVLFHSMMDLPVINGRIDTSSRRFLADARDLKLLSSKGTKLVVFTWQSRPGKKDFLHLSQHAKAVGKILGKRIKQFNWNQDFVSAIKKMNDKDILFLDNVRMRKDQDLGKKTAKQYSRTAFVKTLAPLADMFCNNAFSQSHRSECSILGFTAVLPSFAGPSLLKEVEGLSKVHAFKKPRILLFGGMKNKDSIKLIPLFLKNKKVDLVLVGGFLGQLFLQADGIKFGKTDKWVKAHSYLEFLKLLKPAKNVLKKFGKKIVLPIDVAVSAKGKRKDIALAELPSNFLVKDIGKKTIELFSKKLKNAKTVIWNGPMGVYEESAFALGTKSVARAMVSGKAYAVVGGGDTEAAAKRFGIPAKKFSHVSVAGKAALQFLAGEKLVGVEALEKGGK